MNSMAQGYDPHMLHAANLASRSWDNVSRMTIVARSGCESLTLRNGVGEVQGWEVASKVGQV